MAAPKLTTQVNASLNLLKEPGFFLLLYFSSAHLAGPTKRCDTADLARNNFYEDFRKELGEFNVVFS